MPSRCSAEVLSFGQNRRWRRAMVDHAIVDSPARVLDVASGTAGVARQLAHRAPTHVTGIDLSEPMLRQGARVVAHDHLGDRIDLVVGTAVRLRRSDTSEGS